MDSAAALADLMSFFVQMVRRILKAVEGFGTVYDARSLEAYVEAQGKALAAVVLELCWRLRMKGQQRPKALPCKCGQVQRWKERRPRVLRGVVGDLNMDERHYYRCDHCGAEGYWGDDLLGQSDFTPLAEDRIAVAGKDGAFKQAQATLQRLGVCQVAASTVRDVCMRLGGMLRAREAHAAAEQYGARGAAAEEHPRGVAVGVDGVMVGRVDVQHRRRKSARKGAVPGKGKLKHFFHEVKTLVVFEFNRQGEALRKTYQATQARVEEFRELVALEAQKRGAQTAEVLVFLGDGAAWVWKTAEEQFPNATHVLDWYHAMEHVWAVGRARFGNKEKELWAWVKTCENELWEGRVEAVIAAIRVASQKLGQPLEGLNENERMNDPRWIAYRNIGYFEDNKERMRYPEYRARGLPIGSGVVESACKHVVAARCKRAGMRWDEPGNENILALRCWDLNGRWDEIWSTKSAA
jgi:hypothetical protein